MHIPELRLEVMIQGIVYEELEHDFDQFPKYHMKIFLWDFNATAEKEDIFKWKLEMRVYIKLVNDSNFGVATPENLIVKTTNIPTSQHT